MLRHVDAVAVAAADDHAVRKSPRMSRQADARPGDRSAAPPRRNHHDAARRLPDQPAVLLRPGRDRHHHARGDAPAGRGLRAGLRRARQRSSTTAPATSRLTASRCSDPLAYEVVRARGLHAQWTDNVVDVSNPIHLGNQRIGGVRVGLFAGRRCAPPRNAPAPACAAACAELGSRYLAWIAVLMLSLLVLGIGICLVIQRTLVRPMRQLADAAREIEAGNYGGRRRSAIARTRSAIWCAPSGA